MHPHQYQKLKPCGQSPTEYKLLTIEDLGLRKVAYTVAEALEVLPLGRSSLQELINSGELPVTRFGRRISIAAPDIVALINARRGASKMGEAA